MSLTITGKVIEDENLGLTTLATDNDVAPDTDSNVILSAFQSSISTASSLGAELKTLGIYPDTTTNAGAGAGTTAAIGIAENAIVSTTDQNLKFTTSSGGTLSAVDAGFKADDGNEIFLYSDPSNPDIVLGREGTGTTANPNGTVAFALLLQPTSGGATIWIVQYEALANTKPALGEDANTLDLSNLVYVSGSFTSTNSFNIGTKLPGSNYWLPFVSSSGTSTVLVTGIDASATNPDTVNTSSVGDGSDSDSITPGGALRFDFVSSYKVGSGGGTKDKTFLADGTLNSLAFIEGTGATFDISTTNPTGATVNVQIIAQNETSSTFSSTQTNTSTNKVPIGEIKVWTGGVGGTLIADSARTTGNNGITFGGTTSAPNGVVNGLTSGETIQFTSLNGAQFDQFVAENITGTGNTPGFRILNVTETQTQTNADHTEVGSHIIFEDSVPTASTNTQTATVDEDALVGETTGETGKGGTATGNVSNLFNAGVDTPLTFALSGSTSGLPALTSDGVAVTYAIASSAGVDTLTAKAGAATVFTFALTEATGAYSFTLSAPIDQETPQNGTPEGTFSFSSLSSLIHATDADGSTTSAASGALTLTIIDDQPTASTATVTATVDEDALAGETTGETGFGGTATGSVTSLFNSGADKPLTYALSGSTSGLPALTSDGVAVTYAITSSAGVDTLTAKAGATTVFTFALTEATGAYSFMLSAPIDNETPQNGTPEGTFSFSSLSSLIHATDADGSTTTAASSAVTLTIIDDQPAFIANSSSSGSVDEDALSTNKLPDATGTSATATGSIKSLFSTGADAPLSFALSSVTTSLTSQNLDSGGTALAYSVSSDHTTLTATKGNGGATVFTLTLNTDGSWTFTLSAPVDQAPGANDSSNTKIDFSALIQATDFDGSNATAPANAWTVTVIDDVPANLFPEAIVSTDGVQDAAGSTFTVNLVNTVAADGTVDPNSSLTIDQHAGADGFGALFFTGTNGSQLKGQLDGGAPNTNLQSSGKNIYLFGFGTGTLTATTDSTGAGLPGGAGGSVITADEVFTIALNHTSGQYTFDMLQPINNGANFTFSDFADVPAGDYDWFSLPFNPTTKQPVSPGKSAVFTGLSPGVDTVNPSSTGLGTDKQAVAPGTGVRIDFVDNVHSITSTTALKSLSSLGYLDHYEVNNSGFTLSQVNPTGKTVDIRLDAYEMPEATSLSPGGTFPTDASGTHEAVTEVKIVTEDASGNVTSVLADFTGGDTTKTFTNGGVSQTVEAKFAPSGDSNGVDMIGLKQVPGEFILVSTATGFDRLLATNIGSVYSNKDSFDMGAVSVSTFNVGQPVNMSFNLALQDSDAFNSAMGGTSNLTEVGTGTLNINLTAPTHA